MSANMFEKDGTLRINSGGVASIDVPELLMMTRVTLENIRNRLTGNAKSLLENKTFEKNHPQEYTKAKAMIDGMTELAKQVTKQVAQPKKGNLSSITELNYDSARLSAMGKEFDNFYKQFSRRF